MSEFMKDFFGALMALITVGLIVALVVYHVGTQGVIQSGSQAFNTALATATFQGGNNMSALGGLANPSSVNLTGFGG